MAPVSEFITLTKVYGPQAISRFNLFASIAVTGNPNNGYSSGDALKAVQEEAAIHLPVELWLRIFQSYLVKRCQVVVKPFLYSFYVLCSFTFYFVHQYEDLHHYLLLF